MRHGICRLLGRGALLAAAFFVWTGAQGCRKGEKRGRERPSDARKTRKVWGWPKPRVAWRTPHDGYLYPVALAAGRVVAAVGNRQRLPRRLVAVEAANGKIAWETKPLLAPALVRRAAPWGMCWTVAEAGGKAVFAYQRPHGRVTALDVATGSRLWTVEAEHGAAATKDGVAVSDGKTLRVLEPASGRTLLSLDLSLPALGAGDRKVATGLKKKTCLQGLGRLVIVNRRDGGEVQALAPAEGKLAWRAWEEGELGRHVLRLPVSGKVLLVPTAYADPEHLSVFWMLPPQGPEARPRWHAALPARVQRKWVWRLGRTILVLGRDEARRWYVVRLQEKTGRELSRVQVPSVQDCVLAGGRLACRSGGRVFGIEPASGKVAWDVTVGSGRDRLRTIRAAGRLVLAVTASKVVALDSGKVAWNWKKRLGEARVSVWEVPGAAGDLVFLVVRTRKEEPRQDRLHLLALRQGAVAWQRVLGRVFSRKRPRSVKAGDVEVKPAVVLTKAQDGSDVLFVAAGKNLFLLDPLTGKPKRGFSLPGDPKRHTVLLARSGDALLLDRGGLLLAASASQGRLLWRAFVKHADLTFFGGKEAFFVDTEGTVRWVGDRRKGGGLSKAVAKVIAGGTVAFADAHRLFVRTDRNVLVVDRSTGRVLRKFRPRTYFYRLGNLLFGLERRIRPAEKLGAYVALDVETGRRLWKQVVHAKGGQAELPAPVVVERRWPVAWVRAAGPVFVTTDTLGQCVVAMKVSDGTLAWTVCFDRVLGEPTYARGYLFVVARGRPHAPGQAADSVRSPGAKTAEGLFAIRVRDGQARLVYTPPEDRRVRLGSVPPTAKGLLVAVEAPARRRLRHRNNEFVGLKLWP